MSDNGLADDLFGESENGSAIREPSPIASSSKSPAPLKEELEVKDEDEAEDAGDLFGDEPSPRPRGASSSATPPSQHSADPLEYPEEEEMVVTENLAAIALPQWDHMHATDGKIWHMKLPAYVNIEPKPFDPDFYRETLTDEPIDGRADPTGAKSRMIGVRNTIRWKWVTGADGLPERRSNAKMLRWSDGSVSLLLGSDLFDVAPSQGASLARPGDPTPKNEAPTTSSSKALTTFIAVPAITEMVLATEAPIAGQLSLLPTSMTSKTHMELVKHVGQKNVKHSRMKMLDQTHDPDKINDLMANKIPTAKTVRRSNKAGGGVGIETKARGGGRAAKRGDTDDDSGSDVPRIRPKRERGERDAGSYDEDDGFVVADSEDEEEEEEAELSDDAAYGSKKSTKGKGSGKGTGKVKGSGKGKKRKGSEESLDSIEEAEKKIEAQERERKRARKEKEGMGKGSGEVGKGKSKGKKDVSSEEEDGEGEEEVDGEGEEEEEEDMDMDVESEGE